MIRRRKLDKSRSRAAHPSSRAAQMSAADSARTDATAINAEEFLAIAAVLALPAEPRD